MKNLLSGRGKTLAVVLLLLAASAAIASPTINSDSSIPIASTLTDDATVIVSCDSVPSQLIELAESFLESPQADNQATEAKESLCLPTLPPAVGMVLMGFICVSLVRDRKTWVAILAFLFAGISVLPEMAIRLNRKAHIRPIPVATLAEPIAFADFYSSNFSQQIRHTGLLRHLVGIPRATNAFSRVIKKYPGVLYYTFVFSQFSLNKERDCLVSRTSQFDCFLPALIFCRIPRGPPISA